MVDGLGGGLGITGVRGASDAPPYGVLRGLAHSYFSVSAKAGLQSQGEWGDGSFGWSGNAVSCPEFFSLGVSLV